MISLPQNLIMEVDKRSFSGNSHLQVTSIKLVTIALQKRYRYLRVTYRKSPSS